MTVALVFLASVVVVCATIIVLTRIIVGAFRKGERA